MTESSGVTNYAADVARDEARLKRFIPEFFAGARLVFEGFRILRARPQLIALGMVPPAIVAVVFVGLFVLIGLTGSSLVVAITPFAESWETSLRETFRFFVAIGLLVVLVRVLVNLFTIVTGIVGQPFYEKISSHVESEFGAVARIPTPFWPTLLQGIGDGIRILISAILVSLGIFAFSFIPVIGSVGAPILSVANGGWTQAVDLTGVPFEARGLTLTQRRAVLRAQRPMALGFGVTVFLLFLLPLGAIVMMPAAVAGATLLARRAVGDPVMASTTTDLTGAHARSAQTSEKLPTQLASAALPTPVHSAPATAAHVVAGAPASTGAPVAAPQRRTWDVVLTIILFVAAVVGLVFGIERGVTYLNPQFAQDLADSGYSPTSGTQGAGAVLLVSHIVLFVMGVGVGILLLINRKVAFYAPLTAGVIAAIVFWVVVFQVIVSLAPVGQ